MITAKRDGRLVYHWPASIEELKKAQKAANKTSGNSKEGERFFELSQKASDAAASWQLCACGSLCDAIPRGKRSRYNERKTEDGVVSCNAPPNDGKLAQLGVDFCGNIGREEYDEALETLIEIEIRAGQVLKELGKRIKKYGKPITK